MVKNKKKCKLVTVYTVDNKSVTFSDFCKEKCVFLVDICIFVVDYAAS